MNSRKVALPSGAELTIQLAPFADSKALYQAVLEEAKSLKIDAGADLDVNLFKDIFCSGFSSKKIESCLDKCLSRALYDGQKITAETFEPEGARQDYMAVCFEVASDNIAPFLKSLYAKFSVVLENLKGKPLA